MNQLSAFPLEISLLDIIPTEIILSLAATLLIGLFLVIIPLWRIFNKAGKSGYESIIPLHSNVVIQDIIGKPKWWVFYLLLPHIIQFIILFIIPTAGTLAAGIITLVLSIATFILMIIVTTKIVYGLGEVFGKSKKFGHIFYTLPILLILISSIFATLLNIMIVAYILMAVAVILLLSILPILGYGKAKYIK